MAHSDNRKGEALAALDANGGNVARTARQTGIPRKTLSEWAAGRYMAEDVAEIRQHVKQTLADRCESLLGTLLGLMDDKAATAKFSELAFGVEKTAHVMQLLRGEATSITEQRAAGNAQDRLKGIIAQLGGDEREADAVEPARSG